MRGNQAEVHPGSPAATQMILEAFHSGGLRVVYTHGLPHGILSVDAHVNGVWHRVYTQQHGLLQGPGAAASAS